MWTHSSRTRLTPLLALVALALMVSACKPKTATGPEQTFTVDVPRSETGNTINVTLELAVPQGVLALAGGAAGIIQGAVTYNAADYEPQMTNGDGSLLIRQAEPGPKSVVISVQNNLINRWDLRLGDAQMNFEIRLEDGEYTVEFTRSLPDHLNPTVNAGVGKLNLILDPELSAQVIVGEHTGLLEVKTRGAWTETGDVYQTGSGSATRTITVNMRGGELNLDNR